MKQLIVILMGAAVVGFFAMMLVNKETPQESWKRVVVFVKTEFSLPDREKPAEEEPTPIVPPLPEAVVSPTPVAAPTPEPIVMPAATATPESLAEPSPTATPMPLPAEEPTVTPIATPEPTPLPDPLTWLLEHRDLWPKEVKLTEGIDFTALLNGKPVGTIRRPAGTVVKMTDLTATTLTVTHQADMAVMPIEATDLKDLAKSVQQKFLTAAAMPSPKVTAPAQPMATPVENQNGSMARNAKEAVLAIAMERAKASLAAGMQEQAAALQADIAAAEKTPAESMARQATTDHVHISAIQPVLIRTNNPYLDALAESGRQQLAVDEAPWDRATPSKAVMPGLKAREVGDQIRSYVWLYANPASPLRGDGELLKRLLRRCHAFIDAINLDAEPTTKEKSGTLDQFAMETGISGLVEFISLYPDLLLPSQRKEWDAALQTANKTSWNFTKAANNWNLNIETARMVAMLNLAYYFKNQEAVDKVLRHVDGTIAKMRPDGGFPYNGDANPSVNYHGALIGSLCKIYDITAYPPLAKALAATQWKGLVMGRTDEFWTSPFHKTYRWNYTRGTEGANQTVVTLSKNPYASGKLGRGHPNRDSIAWYREDIPSKASPDNYTIVDRNVRGPRAWYGRFNYAATYHSKSAADKATGGHETLMGAMTVDDPDGRVNSILVNVTPRVRIPNEPAWGKLTDSLRGVYLTGRNYSASAGVYGIATVRQFAYQGKLTEWQGRQVWLGLPDRIIGLLSTVPIKEGAEAMEINTVLRLISGGTAGAAVCKKLEKLGEGRYRYGELDIIVHGSNFPSLTGDVIPYRSNRYPATELTFRAREGSPGVAERYPASANFNCVVEVRPVWAQGEAQVSASAENPVMHLQAAVNGKRWEIFFNPTTTEQPVSLTAHSIAQGTTSLRLTGVNNGLSSRQIPSGVRLAPAGEAVLVTSPDADDHLPGWDSFEQMVSSLEKQATPAK